MEHIVPESMGNKTLVLPVGVVCDSCNGYFATHLEREILESSEYKYLRFNQEIKNKRGRVPQVEILFGEMVVTAQRLGKLEFGFSASDFDKIEEYLRDSDRGRMMIPVTGKSPSNYLMSRWLAKMALEYLAYKWLKIDGWNSYLIEHQGLDPVRKYARAPKKGDVWVYSKREIYDANDLSLNNDAQQIQTIYECDILATGNEDNSEFYFVIAIFGTEYAINIGGNCMDGYYKWLQCHDNISPLYAERNASPNIP